MSSEEKQNVVDQFDSNLLMESMSKINHELMKKLTSFIHLYDEMFSKIAASSSYSKSSSNILLDASVLSLEQVNHIVEMSGTLHSAYRLLIENQSSLAFQRDKAAQKYFPFKLPKYEDIETENMTLKKISLLQDFLLREIVRNQQLEQRVMILEEDLVDMTSKIQNLQKQLLRNGLTSTALSRKLSKPMKNTETTESVGSGHDSTDEQNANSNKRRRDNHQTFEESKRSKIGESPQLYLGRFIRKQFAKKFYFGLICNYTDFLLVSSSHEAFLLFFSLLISVGRL